MTPYTAALLGDPPKHRVSSYLMSDMLGANLGRLGGLFQDVSESFPEDRLDPNIYGAMQKLARPGMKPVEEASFDTTFIPPEAVIQEAKQSITGKIGGYLQEKGDYLAEEYQLPAPQNYLERVKQDIAHNLAANAPIMLLSLLTGAPAAVGGGAMGILAKGGKYKELRDAGIAPAKASQLSNISGAVEGLSEGISLQILSAKTGLSPVNILKRAVNYLGAEVPGEVIAEGVDIAIDNGYITPDMSLVDALKRVGHTAVVAAGSAGVMGLPTAPLNLFPRQEQSLETYIGMNYPGGVGKEGMDLDLHGENKTYITNLLDQTGIKPPDDPFQAIEYENIPENLIKADGKLSLDDTANLLGMEKEQLIEALNIEDKFKKEVTGEVEQVVEHLHTHSDYGNILVDSFLKGKSEGYRKGEGLDQKETLTILQGLKFKQPEVVSPKWKFNDTRADIINNWVQRDADSLNLELAESELDLNEEQYVKLAGEHLIEYGKRRKVMTSDFQFRIKEGKTYGDLKANWNRLDRKVNLAHIEALKERNEGLFKKVKTSKKMNPDYQQAILGAKKGIKTGYVEMNEALGKDTGMAGELYRLFKNTKTELEEASLPEKVAIQQHINSVLTLAQGMGVDTFMRKEAFEQAAMKQRLAIIAEDQKKIGAKKESYKGWLMNKWFLPTTPVTIAFDFFDGMQDGFGALSKVFRRPLNIDHNAKLKQRDELMTPVQNIAHKYRKQLTPNSTQRIKWYSLMQQKDKDGNSLAYKSENLTPEIQDSLVLTEAEMALYNEMRKGYEKLKPLIKRYMIDVLGKEWNPRDDYSHLLVDWEALKNVPMEERLTDVPFLGEIADERTTKHIEQYDPNFTKKLTTKEKIPLKEDAILAYSTYVRTASHVLNMSRDIKMLDKLARSPQFKDIVGDVKQEYIVDWLGAVNTDGYGKEDFPFLDKLRRNTTAGVLGFKLSSMVVQLTALADAAALMGGRNVMRNFKNILASEDLRNQLRESFPEYKDRMHDWGFAELSENPTIAKLQKAGFYGLKQVDSLVAAASLLTAYEQWCEQSGIEMDLKNPQQEGLLKAQEMMLRTQGSSFMKDLPISISTGKGLTGSQSFNKALLQFQTFVSSRFYSMMIYEMMGKGFIGKDKAHGVRVASYMILADAMDIALRGLAVGTLYGLLGGEDYEPEYGKEFARNLYGTIPVVGGAMNSLLWKRPLLPLSTSWEQLKGTVAAKDPKLKALYGMGAVGTLTGIPGTSQLQQILKARKRKSKREEKEKKNHVPFKGYTLKGLREQSSLRSAPDAGKWYSKK